jgi:tetratricopeptide (TPR) repeat protein
LNQIISLLEKENTTLQDIQTAEGNYRKAIALIPQDRAYITERGNLQEVTRDLLFLKFTQIARDNLADKNQTFSAVNQAVRYLEKAVELKPDHAATAQELKNAQFYQAGFQNFINKNWIDAIADFEQLIASDPNFAASNTTVLLAEAYYAIAKRYYTTSVYPDALSYLEQAEFLVWGNGQNLANLFQIQVLIGDTLGQMEEYENAVSYYKYALNAIQAPVKVQNFPAISTRLVAAESATANEDYETAFRAFQDVLKSSDAFYTVSEIDVGRGVNLALFANANLSTLDLVINANDLPNEMVTTQAITLQVPMIEK